MFSIAEVAYLCNQINGCKMFQMPTLPRAMLTNWRDVEVVTLMDWQLNSHVLKS